MRIGTIGTTGAVSGPAAATRAADVLPLVRLHVEEDHVGPRGAPVDAQVAQQVVLDEHQRAQQEGAEAERQHHHQRLVRRAIQVREALAVDVRQSPREEAPQAAHERDRGEPQREDGDSRARGEGEAERGTAGLDHRQRHQARRESERGWSLALSRRGRSSS